MKIGITYNEDIGGENANALIRYITEEYRGKKVVKIDFFKLVQKAFKKSPVSKDTKSFSALLNMIKDHSKFNQFCLFKLCGDKGKDWRDSTAFKEVIEIAKQTIEEESLCGIIIPGNGQSVSPYLDIKNNKQPGKIEASAKKEFFYVVARNIGEAAMVAAAETMKIPIIGICGGHQIINAYYGGKISRDVIEKDPGDTGYQKTSVVDKTQLKGIIEAVSKKNLEKTLTLRDTMYYFHNDIVKKEGKGLTPNAYRIYTTAGGDKKKYIAGTESKDGRIMTFQFHPERALDTNGILGNSLKPETTGYKMNARIIENFIKKSEEKSEEIGVKAENRPAIGMNSIMELKSINDINRLTLSTSNRRRRSNPLEPGEYEELNNNLEGLEQQNNNSNDSIQLGTSFGNYSPTNRDVRSNYR